jgi:hypothetical protein
MFPTQPRKLGRYVVAAVFALFVFKNPVAAAHLCSTGGALLSQGADAISKFAEALQ